MKLKPSINVVIAGILLYYPVCVSEKNKVHCFNGWTHVRCVLKTGVDPLLIVDGVQLDIKHWLEFKEAGKENGHCDTALKYRREGK